MQRIIRRIRGGWTLALLAALALYVSGTWRADAARTLSVSPQGTVTQARQVVIKFDEAMVAFGAPDAKDPARVQCNPAAAGAGQGRWIDEKTWAYDFTHDLPSDTQCGVTLNDGLKSQSGNAVTGAHRYAFSTGGPFPVSVQPYGGEIEEHQTFVLRLNGPATPDSVGEHVWCESGGLGNRIPVQPVDTPARAALLKHFGLEKDSARVLTLMCQQTLPSSAKMQLVYGKGVKGVNGTPNEVERRFDFHVREPFSASMSCERENAKAPCTPLRPVRVDLSAPIARADAGKFRLQGPNGDIAPTFDKDDKDAEVSAVTFAAPLPERATLTIQAPAGLKDVSGRALANADLFPLRTATAPMPPLAKFPSSTFGIIERYAEPGTPPLVPVTLRNVEADLHVAGLNAGEAKFAKLAVQSDVDMRRWMRLVDQFDNYGMSESQIDKLVPGLVKRAKSPVVIPPPQGEEAPKDRIIDVRSLSLLDGQRGVETLALPKADPKALRPFEVVGIPVPKPGFYVIELASPRLGASLLGKPAPMYVRTAVLVTNLGVHFKQGRENSVVWVTTLDKGEPVPNADVHVSDCNGEMIASGKTDSHGLLTIGGPLSSRRDCTGDNSYSGLFVSARIDDPKTGPDMAFVQSDWNRGIEAWRFNVPTDTSVEPTMIAHTVFDRTLLRAGETVSMKHFIRAQTMHGFAFPRQYPTRVTIRHSGSGQTWHFPLKWAADHTADTTFKLPPEAKLGEYDVTLDDGDASASASGDTNDASDSNDGDDADSTDSGALHMNYESGSFRVEAFRLPVLKGTIAVRNAKASPLVAATQAPVSVQIDYVSGGAASNLPVQVSALVKDTSPAFADTFGDFSFTPYVPSSKGDNASDEDDNSPQEDNEMAKLVADKEPLTLDRSGAGALTLKNLPAVNAPKRLSLEATFADPNGEVQTISGAATLWPAAVIAGVKSGRWVSVGKSVPVTALALDLQGKPRAGVKLDVRGIAKITTTSRKRMVGGFYAYDNHTETKDLGTLCSGTSDDHGLLTCDAKLKEAGNIDLVATAHDGDGHAATATTSIWVTREDELWFGSENTDRIDVLPEKTHYEPGETARFQVRMPFRFATALVAVEREGIIETHVVQLDGKDPTVELKVSDTWGPNVYVSVLALRGRIHEVPWYSFFTWGWKAPLEWARAFWYEGRQYEAPTPLVDLSKPAYRYGLAQIRVGDAAHQLNVSVTPDAKRYTVRGKSHVSLRVQLPDGKPVPAGTQIAVAAVDEALLELMPNQSWNLLDAMLQQRAYGVETSTAQMEIVGRRHFGRKAVPAGGGGGHGATRELFDTLLYWNPRVTLDAKGMAQVDVPLNDSITRFRIVAVAASGTERFGTGSASIESTQDLQVISGLPPLVREGDTFRAQFTLRNTTPRTMKVVVTPNVPPLSLDPQTVDLAPNASREVAWNVAVPDNLAEAERPALVWNVSAAEQGGAHASDAVKLAQQVTAALPVTVQQATLAQVDGTLAVPVAPPANASVTQAGAVRGGIAVSLQPKLANGLPGVRRWFERYPYSCLEQQTSIAIGLRDSARWQTTLARMPVYLDRDGLANYFPPSDDSGNHGSPTLTAYLLTVTDEASKLDAHFALADAMRDKMVDGLTRFVEGRIERNTWAPQRDLDLRKLAAIDALSRYGAANARQLGSIEIAPNQWPTSAVIDYAGILSRVHDVPDRDAKLAQVQQILRARLTYQGTQLTFSTASQDNLWWLMTGTEVNAARLALAFVDDPAWKDDMPRLVTGLLALQHNGAWGTTTANVYGSLAVERFSRAFERDPVAGATKIQFGDTSRTVDWNAPVPAAASASAASATPATRIVPARSTLLAWPAQKTATTLSLTQDGTGKPWATIESLAAVALRAPFAAGYRVTKTITPVDPAVKGVYSRGDVVRVHLDIDAQTDMTWVVVNDPIPAGATILGSGLGRDSAAATAGEKHDEEGQWPTFVERGFDGYRAYYEYLPKGKVSVEYTVRLNNVGTFGLPPTRVEALYAPATFGVTPNAPMVVKPVAQAS
ncbi:alpha-2-macroglobulin family protein [Paraburkholderia acidisoli]|uniref:Alpha-2-macroglobulin n=1 Tax=Paraburkholderia acidisoli TaxID=2571748 RepID=A0A7Z2GL92_9BURK|nr:MG2 domain-containing protein [Paraburkholderia acidisoli]QGZ63514.1 alpha-2-macroglobulin [Paraburkholderia acidisoli]